MIGRFFVASAAWALAFSAALSPAHAQSAGQALELPDGYVANEYQTFTAAIALDDKCSALSYQYRSLVDDMVLGSMLDLPGVAGTSSAEMGMQAYYDNIDKIAAPLGEAARARMLRRDGAREGWILWDPMTRSAVPDMVFSDPAIIGVRKAQGSGLGKRYRLDGKAVILPYKGRGLEFALLSLSPALELGPVTGVISAGSGNVSAFGTVDYTNAHVSATDTDCVEGAQCLRFDSQTTRSIKRRVDGGMNRFGLHMVLVRPEGSDAGESASKIRSMTSPALDATYNPPVKDLFPEAYEAARAAK